MHGGLFVGSEVTLEINIEASVPTWANIEAVKITLLLSALVCCFCLARDCRTYSSRPVSSKIAVSNEQSAFDGEWRLSLQRRLTETMVKSDEPRTI